MKPSDCWYKEVCNNHPEHCNTYCIRYMEMEALCKQSLLPESKWKPEILYPGVDLEAFKELKSIKDNIGIFVDEGRNLILYSEYTGNGKSSWAVKLMLSYFNEIWNGNGLKQRALYISTSDLLFRYRQNINIKDEELPELLNAIRNVDLVIWDDIGSLQLKDFDISFLFTLVDIRTSSNKSNIYTTNALPDQLPQFIGDRLFSRVFHPSVQIQFLDGDKRHIKEVKHNG